MFDVNQDEGFADREERVLKLWKEYRIFQKSLETRKNAPLFSTYDGPPFATGLPHYGHLLASTIKDTVFRYKTMQGFLVPRRFGWDCHGLPVENEIEKAKELSGAGSIEDFGIAKFNEECRNIVLRYTKEWEKTIERMGRWVDFSKTWKTMDPSFMESVWWVFKQLFEKGLVYEGFKVMPFSAKLGTPLSNFEANLNYKDVNDPSIVVKFPSLQDENTYFLAWTTTPWTLISHLALAVGPDIEYIKVQVEDQKYILAKQRMSTYFKEDFKELETILGKDLVGQKYLPPFSYFIEQQKEKAFQVLSDEFVSLEDGTGIVHMAPAFGEMDFFVCKKAGIDPVCPVDNNGRFTKEIPEYEGTLVKDADKSIMKDLKQRRLMFHQGQILHRYPFCWRSDTPLIYKAVQTWFVSVETIKDKLIESNEKIHWMPGHLKKGRFGKWLENARDWAISRSRYWGTPIPIWQSEEGDCIVVGSIEELEEKTGKKVDDLHRHYIDELTFVENGKTYKRVPEVFDCWFESGSMPYASVHYPFENKEFFEGSFPSDFIAEGLDQTRGWFYTLTVLSTALFDEPAFKNVIVNGIILAEDGAKMSKRLKNYPEPELVINQYGADAVRLYMLNSGAVKAEDLSFTEKGIQIILRQIMIPFWNSFSFLSTYAKIYHYVPEDLKALPKADIDRWVLSRLNCLIEEVRSAMNQYDLSSAVPPFVAFIDQLTNWYIRRSRTRFWADEDTPDRQEAFATLYHILKELTKIAAPFIPFLSEAIYQELRRDVDSESLHLCDFPKMNQTYRDPDLDEQMQYVQKAVSIGHGLRKQYKLKVRQPLACAYLISRNPKTLNILKKQEKLICEELNVKKLEFLENESSFVTIQAKPNFPVLGKKFGKLMKQIQKEVLAFSQKDLKEIEQGNSVDLTVEGTNISITQDEITLQRHVKEDLVAENDGDITIALETQLNDELIQEGNAREIVNKINTMRREMGFHVSDRIKVAMDASKHIQESFQAHESYIKNEILALSFTFEACEGKAWDLNGEDVRIHIQKASQQVRA